MAAGQRTSWRARLVIFLIVALGIPYCHYEVSRRSRLTDSRMETIEKGHFAAVETKASLPAAHLFERRRNASWFPEPGTFSLNDIDLRFFHDDFRVRRDPSIPLKQFLGFIRIEKTGSTSLLNFLRFGVDDIYPYTSFLRYEHYREQIRPNQHVPRCFFGAVRTGQETLKSQPSDGDCIHVVYTQLLRSFANTLPYLNKLGGKNETSLHVSLEFFTIVRDPVDRLISLFHYCQRIYPHWKRWFTEAQNERLLADDLEGWLKLMATEAAERQDQYAFLAENPEKAISLVQGDSPRILTFVHDCFDTSVRLLVDRKPQFFTLGAAESFLNSTRSTANRRPKKTNDEEAKLRRIREKAKRWFKDDYRFYHAAIEQFRRHLASSNLEPSEIAACNAKLDKRLSGLKPTDDPDLTYSGR